MLATATAGWFHRNLSSSIAIDTTSSFVWTWQLDGAGTEYVTGSQISVRSLKIINIAADTGEYVSNITNMKDKYTTSEKSLRVCLSGQSGLKPTIYTVATTNIETKRSKSLLLLLESLTISYPIRGTEV